MEPMAAWNVSAVDLQVKSTRSSTRRPTRQAVPNRRAGRRLHAGRCADRRTRRRRHPAGRQGIWHRCHPGQRGQAKSL